MLTRTDLSTPALIDAIEANSFEILALVRRWPRAEVHDDPDMLWTITDLPFSTFNCVLRAQLAREQVDAAIATMIGRGRARNVPLLWFVGPATSPQDLGAALEAQGFIYRGHEPGMAANLHALPENPHTVPDLVIEQVGDAETLATWCRTHAAGFGSPDSFAAAYFDFCSYLGVGAQIPFRSYLGRLRGEPVATASLMAGAGVAGIYDVATLGAARRQGIGAAMTWHAMQEGRAMGYHVSTLWAAGMGVGIYRRLGFQAYCQIGIYEWLVESD